MPTFTLPIPFFLIIFIAFIAVFTYKTKQTRKEFEKERKEFWDQETQSNFTRKKSIEDLLYIKVDLNQLPINETTTDNKLKEIQEKIKSGSQLTMVDLRNKSNTDLKLSYGYANLEDLTVFESNFMSLLRTFYQWGQRLYEINAIDTAMQVLEYGIHHLNTDISHHYILLGNLYKEKGQRQKLNQLIHTAEELNSLMKSKIVKHLKSL